MVIIKISATPPLSATQFHGSHLKRSEWRIDSLKKVSVWGDFISKMYQTMHKDAFKIEN